jgi:RAT1-interacting protein
VEKALGMETCVSILHQRYSIVSLFPASRVQLIVKVLRATILGDGVWRIRRKERTSTIEVFKVEETGHGDILSDEFINWRIKLALNRKQPEPSGGSELLTSMGMDTVSAEAP